MFDQKLKKADILHPSFYLSYVSKFVSIGFAVLGIQLGTFENHIDVRNYMQSVN